MNNEEEKTEEHFSLDNESKLLKNKEIEKFYNDLNENLEILFILITEYSKNTFFLKFLSFLGSDDDVLMKCQEILETIKELIKKIKKDIEKMNTLGFLVHRKIYLLIERKYNICSIFSI